MKYKGKRGKNYQEIELEDKDCLLIEAIDNLTQQLKIQNNR